MSSINVSIRNTNTKGEINNLRSKGIVPAIIYGGKEENQKDNSSLYLEILNSKYPAKTLEKIEKSKILSSNTLEKVITNIEHSINNLYKHQLKYNSNSDIIYSQIIKRRVKIRELKLYICKKIHLNKNLSIEQLVFK